MNDKVVGTIFCLIAAILMSARYLAAAIFMSNVSSWDESLFLHGLECTGAPLLFASAAALAAGIAFLVYGIYQDKKKK